MLIDERTIRAAESAVSARKALLVQQWGTMRTRIGDKLVQPSTLLTVAAVGGIFGWRRGAPKTAVEPTPTCECPPAQKPSLLAGALGSLAVAGLQVVASIASEEFVRSAMARASGASGSATAEAVDAAR